MTGRGLTGHSVGLTRHLMSLFSAFSVTSSLSSSSTAYIFLFCNLLLHNYTRNRWVLENHVAHQKHQPDPCRAPRATNPPHLRQTRHQMLKAMSTLTQPTGAPQLGPPALSSASASSGLQLRAGEGTWSQDLQPEREPGTRDPDHLFLLR